MSSRLNEVVEALIDGIRGVLTEKGVTLEEYRAAVNHLKQTAAAGELPLLCDVYFNITIVENENAQHQGTNSDLEGPYYLPDAPFVDGALETMEEFGGEPMLIQGRVTNTDGEPVAGALLDLWQSTPDGKYSGFQDNIPIEYYHGKIRSDADGRYQVRSTVPVPYQIPNQGPTGSLLRMLGGHTWRPAHIHFKVSGEGYHPITLQAYFEGGKWLENDCCSSKCTAGQNIIPRKVEDGVRIMDVDIVMEGTVAKAA